MTFSEKDDVDQIGFHIEGIENLLLAMKELFEDGFVPRKPDETEEMLTVKARTLLSRMPMMEALIDSMFRQMVDARELCRLMGTGEDAA